MPAFAVMFTVIRIVQVLPGRMALFSLHTTGPVAPTAGVVHPPKAAVPDREMLENVVPSSTPIGSS